MFRQKCLTFLLVFSFILYPVLEVHSIIIDKIMAKVNNEVITQSEIEEQIDALREELLKNYKPEDVENVIKKQRIEILGKTIETKLMLQEAKRLNVKVNETEVDKEVEKEEAKLKENFPDTEKFLEYLKSKGLNPDSLKEKLTKSIQENMLLQRLIFREVRSQIEVTESEVKEYFLHLGEETHA
ncbi:MAG: SurA N-terminal domain-containing protein, partial [Candidatus Firestonebacteria bacterium]|nr:SurA N-terminal domain-containing protein [Candidatus Firestonebacteria bacterium]